MVLQATRKNLQKSCLSSQCQGLEKYPNHVKTSTVGINCERILISTLSWLQTLSRLSTACILSLLVSYRNCFRLSSFYNDFIYSDTMLPLYNDCIFPENLYRFLHTALPCLPCIIIAFPRKKVVEILLYCLTLLYHNYISVNVDFSLFDRCPLPN